MPPTCHLAWLPLRKGINRNLWAGCRLNWCYSTTQLKTWRDLRFIFIIYNSFFQVCVDECILVLRQVLKFTSPENKRGLYWSQNINRKGEVVLSLRGDSAHEGSICVAICAYTSAQTLAARKVFRNSECAQECLCSNNMVSASKYCILLSCTVIQSRLRD